MEKRAIIHEKTQYQMVLPKSILTDPFPHFNRLVVFIELVVIRNTTEILQLKVDVTTEILLLEVDVTTEILKLEKTI
jgi:hypothetical protein